MLRILATLTAVLGLVNGVIVSMPESSVNTTVGANITLPCTYKTASAPAMIQWNIYSAKNQHPSGIRWTQITYNSMISQPLTILAENYGHCILVHPAVPQPSPCLYRGEKSTSHCGKSVSITDTRGRCSWIHKIYLWQLGKGYFFGQFKGRTRVANTMGNATLSIVNMQPSDTGSYRCLVFNPNDTNPESEKSVSVSVLVPPSKPVCNFGSSHHPDVEIGHLITLFCVSTIGLPIPTYKWYKLNGDQVNPVTELYDPSTGRLVLGNLTRFEEGYYQCTATNPLGNSSCQIDLTTKHSESGIIVGALIAAILAAALICVVGWILISREKKKRKQKPVLKEMQTMSPKAEYAAVPSQTSVPVAAVPPNKEPNETGEDDSPEEAQVAIIPENETQEMGHQPVS